MLKYGVLLMLALVLAAAAAPRAQSVASVSGTWTFSKADPPVETGRGGGGRGGGIGGPYAETTFSQAPQSLVVTQTATGVTVQVGSVTEVFTLDGKQTVVPPGDVNGLKTWAHWDGSTLHLHFKQGMNWGRDILSVTGNTLTVVRDLESGGQSTTRAITYTKM